MNRLREYLLKYSKRYLVGGACLFVTATMVMAIPAVLQRAIDQLASAVAGNTSAASMPGDAVFNDAVFNAAPWALAIIALAVGQALVRTVSRSLIFNAGRDVEYDLRNDLFVHLTTLPQSWYHRQRTGDLMSRLVNDLNAVRLLLGLGVLTIINTPLYCIYALTLMAMMDLRLTLAALLPFPLMLWVIRVYSHRMMDASVSVQERIADISSSVQETLAGVSVIKAWGREQQREGDFAKLNERFKNDSMELVKLRGKVFPLVRVVSSLGVLAVLYYGGTLVVRGELTLGQLVAFMAYLNIIAWPVMALGWLVSIYQRGRAAMLRLGEILDARPEIASPEGGGHRAALRGGISLQNVSFTYPSDQARDPALRNVTLELEAGTSLGVLGATGSGKSTLASLVARVFDPDQGRVMVDGVDLRDWNLGDLRRGIGFVPQDPFLFSSSIEDNIAFARDDLGDEELGRLVEIAALDTDLAEFPHGMDTQVGERGLAMSGGQKQRLTLARAVARDPAILVLDDALSSIDAATESRILDELESVMEGRSSIIVSHRVAAVRRADRVVVLEEGRVVEDGTPDELAVAGGLYSRLLQRQQLADELEAM